MRTARLGILVCGWCFAAFAISCVSASAERTKTWEKWERNVPEARSSGWVPAGAPGAYWWVAPMKAPPEAIAAGTPAAPGTRETYERQSSTMKGRYLEIRGEGIGAALNVMGDGAGMLAESVGGWKALGVITGGPVALVGGLGAWLLRALGKAKEARLKAAHAAELHAAENRGWQEAAVTYSPAPPRVPGSSGP